MPQKSVALGSIVHKEVQLPEKIFGKRFLKRNLSNLISPNPLPIFCRNEKNEEFQGDNISSMQFCNDFFLAPTHVGICMSKNMNVSEIVQMDDNYYSLLEANGQSSKLKVRKSNYWAVSTFIINVLKVDSLKVSMLKQLTFKYYLEFQNFIVIDNVPSNC